MTIFIVVTGLAWLIACGWWIGVVRVQGVVKKFQYLIQAVVFTLLSLLLSTILIVLHAFQAFSGETLVAQVTAKRLAAQEFELTYLPIGKPGSAAIHATLEGDQWMISGGLVKWHPWLTMFGMKSYHKPLRLSGQFSDAAMQRDHLPTLALLTSASDHFWEALYWADPYLPFVEAVYGTAAYAYVEPGVIQEVYVTPSGYMIKRGPER